MDLQTLLLLDFPKILEILRRFAQSPMGRAEVSRIGPLPGRERLQARLDILGECVRFYEAKGRLLFGHLEDPQPLLSELRVQGQALEPAQFLVLLDLLKSGQELKRAFSPQGFPILAGHLETLPAATSWIEEIERVIDSSGEIRENAHPELRRIRQKQLKCRQQIQDHLRAYFSGAKSQYLIDEPFVTLRNGRYVIPLRAEHQRRIPGVAHGSSSSGATVFMEPLTAVELNNDCLYYQEREQEIIFKILRALTDYLRPQREAFEQTIDRIAQMDALFACAQFSARYHCVIPRLSETRALLLEKARHPLLLKSLGEERVVPVSIRLSDDQNGLVISGPNAGGKTVALKTAGLISIMALSALPVPAAEAVVPLFHQVLADIGDRQSIAEQLSTFSAHVLRIREMIERLDPPSLVLLDEVGTGTDPVHGSALGVALIDYFRRRETLVIATTHHHAIKQFAFSTPGIDNASVELDPETLKPTYELKFGVAGGSSGLEIALQLGLSPEIINQARTRLDETDLQLENYLQQLRQELAALERQRGDIEREIELSRQERASLEQKYQKKDLKRQEQLEQRFQESLSEFRAEMERFIKTVKDRFEAARLRKEARKREASLKEAFRRSMSTAREAETYEPASAHPSRDCPPKGYPAAPVLRKGDRVFHSFFGKAGEVLELKGADAVLEIEGKRITAPLNQLKKIEEKSTVQVRTKNVIVQVVENSEPELNLVGSTVDDALIKLDKFLDRAFVSNLREVRIIHGFGTGRLRKALSEFLSGHPHVATHRVQGGATIVEIRQ
ncbi:MAG: endonuclease MutS2 [Acidobacteriota bacterium]